MVVNWKSVGVLALFLGSLSLFIYTFAPDKRAIEPIVMVEAEEWDQSLYQEMISIRATNVVLRIRYIYDASTDICYAVAYCHMPEHQGVAMTAVPYEKVKDYAVVINRDELSQKRDP